MHRLFLSILWPAILCCVPGAALPDAVTCAALAASPTEQGQSGVPFAKVDAAAAVPACRRAVADDPADFASAYRLARGLLAGDVAAEALPHVRRAADAGYPHAHDLLGWMLFSGSGLPEDRAASLAAYARAYELGLKIAAYNLGWFHHRGVVVPQDRAKAAAFYREAAEAGGHDAAHALAEMLWHGDGVSADQAEALRLLRSASEVGHAPSQAALAMRLMNGDGVPRDDAEAYRLARLASAEGHGYGAYLAGFALEHGRGVAADLAAAVAMYERSAASGDISGKAALGQMLAQGSGTDPDPARARILLAEAAEGGSTEAQARLGRMLAFGQGGPADAPAARTLLEQAEAHPVSRHARGMMAWLGAGVPQDRAGGLALVRAAADAGLADAQVDAAVLLSSAEGGEPFRDLRAAVGYLAQAAEQDHARALFLYGTRLFDGDGVARDTARGLELLDRAAALGFEQATEMAALSRQELQAEREVKEARAALCRAAIRLCNRGCETRDDGTTIYNTRDGTHWFEESGRLIPAGEAPDYGCPQ